MGQILGTTVSGTAIRRPTLSLDRRAQMVVLAVLIASVIGATMWTTGVFDAAAPQMTGTATIGNADDYALRHATPAKPLTFADDFATRHVGIGGLTPADDFGTRHGVTAPALGEQDDYATRSR